MKSKSFLDKWNSNRNRVCLIIFLLLILLLVIPVRDFSIDATANDSKYDSPLDEQLKSSSFNVTLTKSVGGGPEHVVVEDANNDGYRDIITANYWDDNVSIILWNSSISDWEEHITRSVGDGPSSVFVGDVNNDGFNDIITADYWDGNISILIWNTTLLDWEEPATKSVGNGPESAVLGDLNNDGYNDIVTANNWDNTISFLIWNESLGFWNPEVTQSVGDGPEDIFVGDVNNDGLNDTVITNYSDDTISLFLWNGSSNAWNTQIILAVGDGPGSVFVEDANNDGYSDIVTSNYVGDTISIFTWNNSAKIWNQETSLSVGDGPESVLVDDVNIDGYNDIITTNYGDNDISILIWNVISSDWNPQVTKSVGNRPQSAVIEDLNFDGHNDLVVSNFQDNNLSILLFMTNPIPDDIFEENDDILTASYITNDTLYTNLAYLDLDYYYFNVSKGFLINPKIEYYSFSTEFYLYLYNSSFDLVAESRSNQVFQYLVNYTDDFYLGILCTELYTYYNLTISLFPLPGNFSLTSDAANPDLDGNFTLSWGSSADASNYSIYQHSSYISEINISIILVKEGIIHNNYTLYNYTLSNYLNGTYYFIILATNFVGSTLSNCISINVSIPAPPKPPGNFTLSSNAITPDDDGNFTLFWSISYRAINYSVYQYSKFISEINSSLNLLARGLTNNSLKIFDYVNGTYYFIVLASNNVGINLSDCILITVSIPPLMEPEEPQNKIRGYSIFFILTMIVVYGLVIKNIRRKMD